MSEHERRQPYQVVLNILAMPVIALAALMGVAAFVFLMIWLDHAVIRDLPRDFQGVAWLVVLVAIFWLVTAVQRARSTR